MTQEALLIFTKNLEAGKVKTRLAASIGNEAAVAVYSRLLIHTASITGNLPVDKFVFYSDYIAQDDVWNGQQYTKKVQYGADLGDRMKYAFASTLHAGYRSAVIIGTDCPGLTEDIIMDAIAALHVYDVVLGPAEDGGYYLLGMKDLHVGLFEDMHWSTSRVLSDTIARCVNAQLSHHLLPILQDIDEEKDLEAFNHKWQI